MRTGGTDRGVLAETLELNELGYDRQVGTQKESTVPPFLNLMIIAHNPSTNCETVMTANPVVMGPFFSVTAYTL